MKITKQKGTRDIYGQDIKIWQYIEQNIREICKTHCFNEIRTPVFEATELFARGVGDETDIVNKEMYTFLDKGGRSITLRPELTAGVVRAYIENGMSSMVSPVKLWYEANMYRYEKMQKGRYREFTQFGIEYFGSKSYLADIEVITLAYELFKKLNLIDKVTLTINSIGCIECRKKYIEKLKEYIKPNLDKMCDTCKIRYEKNPLRMLDCKEDRCQNILENAPMITDYICDECKSDFEALKSMLDKLGIKYEVDKRIVRGLDYYNKTVFEYISNEYGFAVCAGGRYDKLVENIGGESTSAVGFGMGLDRICLLLENSMDNNVDNVDIYFAVLDKDKYSNALKMVLSLRENNIKVEIDTLDRSFNAKLKYANKINAKYVCIIGDELKQNKCTIKNMENSKQDLVDFKLEKIISIIK